MRVVTIIPHVGNEASGPSYSVVRLAQSLARAGADVLLLSVRDGQLPASERFEHRVYPKAGFPASLWRSPALARALREEAPYADVLHAHGMWVMPAVYPGREARRARRP